MSAVSLDKLAAGPHYGTTYGGTFGYNGRQIGQKAQHFEKTWDRQYPNPERIRRQAVSAIGYDNRNLGRLYNRSAHVQSEVQDETGLLGHARIDNYDKIYAMGQYNTYNTVPVSDDPVSLLPTATSSNIEYYAKKSGHPAFVTENMPGCRIRRQIVMPPVRWTSRKAAETGLGGKDGLKTNDMIVNPKTTIYDSEYSTAFANADRLDSSGAMRNSSKIHNAGYHPRSLLPLSQSLAEQQSREPTGRAVNMQVLNDRSTIAGREVSFTEMEQRIRPDLTGNYDMRDHIPQYRAARATAPNADVTNLGIRNIGPLAASKSEKFWEKPSIPADTFSNHESRPINQLMGGPPLRDYSKTLRATQELAMAQVV